MAEKVEVHKTADSAPGRPKELQKIRISRAAAGIIRPK